MGQFSKLPEALIQLGSSPFTQVGAAPITDLQWPYPLDVSRCSAATRAQCLTGAAYNREPHQVCNCTK